MNPKTLMQIIASFVENTPKPKASKIKNSSLPEAARTALNAWLSSNNITVDDPDTSADFYLVKYPESPISDTYLADYSGDDPDQFRAMCIIQNGSVIGESIDVGD